MREHETVRAVMQVSRAGDVADARKLLYVFYARVSMQL